MSGYFHGSGSDSIDTRINVWFAYRTRIELGDETLAVAVSQFRDLQARISRISAPASESKPSDYPEKGLLRSAPSSEPLDFVVAKRLRSAHNHYLTALSELRAGWRNNGYNEATEARDGYREVADTLSERAKSAGDESSAARLHIKAALAYKKAVYIFDEFWSPDGLRRMLRRSAITELVYAVKLLPAVSVIAGTGERRVNERVAKCLGCAEEMANAFPDEDPVSSSLVKYAMREFGNRLSEAFSLPKTEGAEQLLR